MLGMNIDNSNLSGNQQESSILKFESMIDILLTKMAKKDLKLGSSLVEIETSCFSLISQSLSFNM